MTPSSWSEAPVLRPALKPFQRPGWLEARSPVLPGAILMVAGAAAVVSFVGADARWLAALGGIIAKRHAIPSGVPFAAAPTAQWPNAIVLAEVIIHALEAGFGDRGLMIAQLLALICGMTFLARDARAGGARDEAIATALLVAALGSLPSLAVARVQLFSLALFPLLLALLRSETRRPTHRIWLVLPLLALWSNLHGAALIGLGMTLLYLVLERSRREPRTTILLALGAGAAICLTPAGVHSPAYYIGILSNEAAKRGDGLWGPLSLSDPIDLLLVVCTIVLAARIRVRMTLWEVLVGLVLVGLTAHTSRSGVWLLFFLVAPSARSFSSRRAWRLIAPALGVIALVVLTASLVRGPLPSGASGEIIHRAIALSGGTPILADDMPAEQVAVAGGRILIGNPIDAFSKRDQASYLDWSEGKSRGGRQLLAAVDVVVSSRGGAAERLMGQEREFRLVASDRNVRLYLRTRA